MCSPQWSRRDLLRTAGAAGVVAATAAVSGATAASATAAPEAPARRNFATPQQPVALKNVRVFNGTSLTSPTTVVISNGVIGFTTLGAQTIDCQGATLLPGLIDAHVHLQNVGTLQQLSGYGVTTALDMACWPPALVNSLRHQTGLTDIRSAGTPAVEPGSIQSQIPGFPASGIVTGPDQAAAFVRARVAEGSDYIKLIVDTPGLSQATLNALSNAAHSYGKQVMAHAVSSAAVNEALAAGVDMVHHVPLDTPITAAVAQQYLSRNRVSVPTLTIMQGFAQLGIPGLSYAAATASVAALHHAGVRILAGTDSNHTPGIPVQPAFGISLHHELQLLVQAGLSTVETLRAATSAPAQAFGLLDRGVVLPGYRADLVLIDGDPIADISATQNIERIWIGGIEYPPAV